MDGAEGFLARSQIWLLFLVLQWDRKWPLLFYDTSW